MSDPSSQDIPEKTHRSTAPNRMPTLEALAARINPSASTSSSSSSSRPRLPASILSGRSHNDSANASTTLDPDHADSTSATVADEPQKEKITRGYKNVPSLEAITERMRAKTISQADVTINVSHDTDTLTPPDAAKDTPPLPSKDETRPAGEIEETHDVAAEEGSSTLDDDAPLDSADVHPLKHTWTLYHDSKSRNAPPTAEATQTNFAAGPDSHAYAANLTTVGDFNSVEGFCQYFNWLKPPSQLEKNSNYHLFKDGIKPMWEDKANAEGGKWVLTMKSHPQLLDRSWSWLAMALIGEQLDDHDEICGAVVSLRKVDRIQLWTRTKDDVERINSIGKKLIKLLDITPDELGVGLEFQLHSGERTNPKFITFGTTSSSTFNRGTPTSTIAPGFPAPAPSSGWRGGGRGGSRGGSSFGIGGGGAFGGGSGGHSRSSSLSGTDRG